jgi:hypothetical protein
MANYFKSKTKANVGIATSTVYTVPAATSAVVIGITLCNTTGSGINVSVGIARTVDDSVYVIRNVPIPQGTTLEYMQGNKIVLEPNDALTALSDTNSSLDCTFAIMETTG